MLSAAGLDAQSALEAAGGNTFDDVALNEDVQDQHRHRSDGAPAITTG